MENGRWNMGEKDCTVFFLTEIKAGLKLQY
jgi:hypothetical protein